MKVCVFMLFVCFFYAKRAFWRAYDNIGGLSRECNDAFHGKASGFIWCYSLGNGLIMYGTASWHRRSGFSDVEFYRQLQGAG